MLGSHSLLGRGLPQPSAVLIPGPGNDGDPATLHFNDHRPMRGMHDDDISFAVLPARKEGHVRYYEPFRCC